MKDLRLAFNIMEDEENVPIVYQKVHCHMVFDVNMENFCQKDRLVCNAHNTRQFI